MSSTAALATTYGLSQEVVDHFTSLNHFEATKLINEMAGNHLAQTIDEMVAQLGLIKAELLKELEPGVHERNLFEIRDGIADVVFTAFGLASRGGIDAHSDYVHPILSNVCKFDTTIEDAELTKQKYLALEVETIYVEYSLTLASGNVVNFYVTKVAGNQAGNDGRHYPEGKWLKSHKWVDCQYDPIDESTLPYLHIP